MTTRIVTDRRCRVCGACWFKNHMTDKHGKPHWVGYYHLCNNGGNVELARVDLDMVPRVWDAPRGNRVRDDILKLGA
jgi:hypothetical protein